MHQPVKFPEAIFMDWDGTLVDTYELLQEAHNAALSTFGLPLMRGSDFRKYFGRPRDEIYKALYGSRGDEARTIFEGFVHANHVKMVRPMAGADELLKVLNDWGVKLAVISNKRSIFLNREVEALGWGNYFCSVIGSGDAEKDKPYAEPLDAAYRQSGVTSDKQYIWYVGDTEIDLMSAENAGMQSVLVHPDTTGFGWFEKYKPLRILKDCAELREFLLQCRQNQLKVMADEA